VGVYGGAIATMDGIRRVLLSVGAAPDAPPVNGRQVQAVWHLQREEPVIYVNGRPYVLREASRPFKNLLEYHGITAARLEMMEARLREDILAEAAAHDGRLLVTREAEADSRYGSNGGGSSAMARQVVEAVEPVAGPDAVQTPKQVGGLCSWAACPQRMWFHLAACCSGCLLTLLSPHLVPGPLPSAPPGV
jgi:hypothetical protein